VNRHTLGVGLAVVSILGLPRLMDATNQAPASSPVSKATGSVELIPGGESSVRVQIRNLSDVPIEAWRYRLSYDVGSGPSSVDVVSDAGLDPNSPGGGAIQPRTTRSQVVALPGIPVNASVAVTMLILSDGTSEGSNEYRDGVFRQRERQAATLNLWIEALESVSGKQGPEARSALERVRRLDKRYTPDPSDSWALAMDQNIRELISSDEVDQLPARLGGLLTKCKSQRDRALRHTHR